MSLVRAFKRLVERYGLRIAAAALALRIACWAFSCVGEPATGPVDLTDAALAVFAFGVAMAVSFLAGCEPILWRQPRRRRWWEVDS
ncbi:hypothetical protein [Burkholderia ubonensis]|uniref:hypothetical protein n=1 Tax=Burkholderia ubonensis TaxID=101571 RepID=UPI00076DE501|nr:hypothetical protein [Burkholderia ubonensis]KWB50909.1 hypothetical protein WL36_05050 [Burkholderia ubonensis]